tara:strand:- start:1193 stop:1588 length:396 start_codon:yes stop_codon:yes gene_type:complete
MLGDMMKLPCAKCSGAGGRFVPGDPNFVFWHGLCPSPCGTGMRIPTDDDGPWVPCEHCGGLGVSPKVQARHLKVGMRFVSDGRWRKMSPGRVYTIKGIETFGKGDDMRWTVSVSDRSKLQMRAHETLDVIS